MTNTNPKTTPSVVYRYKIKLDIEKDAWNWFDGCNSISHGMDWKRRVPKEIGDKVHGKSEKEAYDFLIPFLKQKYIDKKAQHKTQKALLDNEFKKNFSIACQEMVNLMSKPLYRNDFTFFLTTFPRAPYNYEQGYIWVPFGSIGRNDAIRLFLHELSHFQFIYYWMLNENSMVSKLSYEKFDYLKESLTVILDEDLCPLISSPDQGYEMHKKFRQELHKFWKANKNFEKLVEFGLKKLPNYI